MNRWMEAWKPFEAIKNASPSNNWLLVSFCIFVYREGVIAEILKMENLVSIYENKQGADSMLNVWKMSLTMCRGFKFWPFTIQNTDSTRWFFLVRRLVASCVGGLELSTVVTSYILILGCRRIYSFLSPTLYNWFDTVTRRWVTVQAALKNIITNDNLVSDMEKSTMYTM